MNHETPNRSTDTLEDITAALVRNRKLLKEANTQADKIYAEYELIAEEVVIITKLISLFEKRLHRAIDKRAGYTETPDKEILNEQER